MTPGTFLQPVLRFFTYLKRTFIKFDKDHCMTLASSAAYFSLISLAPMLVLVLSISSLAAGSSGGEERLLQDLSSLIGVDASQAIGRMIQSAELSGNSVIMTMVGSLVLIFGATTLFAKITQGLNIIFGPGDKPPAAGIMRQLRNRLVSLSVVLGIALLLLATHILDTLVISLFGFLAEFLKEQTLFLWVILQNVISLGLSSVLLASLLKVMPRRRLQWKHTFAGGLLASVLFSITKILFGIYVGSRDLASAYGAAGTIVVLLLWVYVSAMVFYFGAEFTSVLMDSD